MEQIDRHPAAYLENIEYLPGQKLDREQILCLASCAYLLEGHNVIILRPLGLARPTRPAPLAGSAGGDFWARANGIYRDYMKRLKKEKLLILDAGLLYPLKATEAEDVLELVEARNKVTFTIFCSQYDTTEWHRDL